MTMNCWHRLLCRSTVWERVSGTRIVPWALAGTDLGDRTLEIGPGYGANIAALHRHTTDLTGLEIDPDLADRLRTRHPGRLRVIDGDGTAMPLPDSTFGSVVCFTMLHHVPSPAQQDTLFAEALRVVRPGGVFAGADGLDTRLFRFQHLGDTCVPVPPDTLPARLTAAGFTDIRVDPGTAMFRFSARRPAGS
ncbi:class I SAM-dependent methyltransferase [Nocardia stercoris]|uniref:Class I SAM-dependent methyltransferase n=1 Tax=Nocardia stercoris TaxID=2483361 RepID=A0A3M2L0N8_9NOCA|nr:class I SAM-dependent methyltransferase [Nocardia stercoris]RMI31287.1 class I SAM-dependent methyltransferase [Nocardia stercoris]